MRLFAAIDLPEEVKDALEKEISVLKGAARKGSYSKRRNLHLTLAFLGEVPEHRLAAAVRAMENVREKTFVMKINGFGSFSSDGGKIYWRGVERDAGLMAVRRSLYRSLLYEGFSPDEKPFRPHITLARGCDACEGRLDASAFKTYCVEVRQIVLFRSDRPAGRLTYTGLFQRQLS